MVDQSSQPKQSLNLRASTAPTAASPADVLRWITLLPGVFLASLSFGGLAGGVTASILARPVPTVMDLVIPVFGGWTGVLFAYCWAPDRKWSAARATGLLLGASRLSLLLFWSVSAGWAGLRQYWFSSFAVSLAIAAAPWLLQKVVASRHERHRRPCDQQPACAHTAEPESSPKVGAQPAPADETPTTSAPAPGWDALRWAALLPAAVIAYYGALCAAFLSLRTERAKDDGIWLAIVLSHAIAGWAALLCSAWLAPARKRSVAYVGYLVFLTLSLPLSGRMLTACGLDAATTIMGLWLMVAAAVAPVPWAVQRVWGPRRR